MAERYWIAYVDFGYINTQEEYNIDLMNEFNMTASEVETMNQEEAREIVAKYAHDIIMDHVDFGAWSKSEDEE